MNKKIILLLCVFLCVLTAVCFAQNSLVNVNPLTGAGNVVIPIYTVSSGQVSVPISISYSGNGIKTKDVEGTAGMGWQLNAGGQISRVVRGLPDDCSKDNTGVAMLGWMNTGNTGASYASTYTILNNGVTCSNGATDIANINANIPYMYDTEPDVFYVNAPGLSCQLVYDRATSAFHPVNYQDLVIHYAYVGGSGNNANNIASFTIINDKGIQYVFAAPESVTQSTTAGTNNYFTTQYKQYQRGITYADAWNLTGITDANGNGIAITYSAASVRNSTDPVELFLSGSATQSVQYKVLEAVTPQVANAIYTTNVNSSTLCLNITWNSPQETVETGQSVVTGISGMGRNFQFTYKNGAYIPFGYTRAFLTNFSDNGCGTPVNYQFAYTGVNPDNGSTALGDSTSTQVDYWGYFSTSASTTTLLPSVYVNPASNGYPRYVLNATTSPGSAYQYTLTSTSNRAVTASSVIDGALNKITYAEGGSTNITYEPNQYYDAPSASNIFGGGIRVKQIIDSTGSGSTNNIVRNYTYVNPSSPGISSGVPVTLPQYAFTIPYSGSATGQSLWVNATALSAYDLSEDDHTIMYAYTRVSQTGAGSTLYSYNIPATYLSTSAGPICSGCTNTAEWQPTVSYAASYNCAANNGPIANLTYSYPFIPNPNYDFERGRPASVINYNDNGNEVSETDYAYQRSYNPTAITAFKAEDGPTGSVAKFYNRYTVFYNTSELLYTLTKKVYDSNTLSQAQTSTTIYTYGSTYHKLLTQETAANSDNSTVSTYFKYVKDYGLNAASSNANINALYNLQLLNINAPVETYQQVTRNGATVTTSAALTLFAPSTNGTITNYLPSQQLKMAEPDGVPSAASPAAFTPSSVSGTIFNKDSRYNAIATYSQFDNTGYPETVADNSKHIQTSFYDHLTNHATAVFKNASYNEVAFNDFDSKPAPSVNTFTISGTGTYTPVGSHAGNAAGLATGQTITSGNITKNGTAQNYILSVWINPSAAGTLIVNGASTGYAINYSTMAWTYYELKIPASALSSTFVLNLTSNQNISIDDVLLYPDVAEATTATYDPVSHYKIAQTNTNGVSAYYSNDQWGRILYAFDQDRNIVLRKQYVNAAAIAALAAPSISASPNIYSGIPVLFTNNGTNLCFTEGMTYTWDFGDGTPPVVNTTPNGESHTYAANGSYTVTVTENSPLLGSKTGSLGITVTSLPAVKINYSNTCLPGGPDGKFPTAIETVNFIQNGVTVYSFNTNQLIAGPSIAPGIYTIQIIPTGSEYTPQLGYGYLAVTYLGGTGQCFPFTGSSFTITDDVSHAPNIYLGIQPTACN